MAEEPEFGTTDSFSASLVTVSPLVPAVVATMLVVRAADALAMPLSTGIVGCIKGFTAQVCVLNSSSRFLLFVSGSTYTCMPVSSPLPRLKIRQII